jgi:hypothetical protein
VTTEDTYVAAVYLVVFVVVLAWVLIIATKLGRLQREVGQLTELARRKRQEPGEPADRERETVG